MTLFYITEKFPETSDVFVANGYGHVVDAKLMSLRHRLRRGERLDRI